MIPEREQEGRRTIFNDMNYEAEELVEIVYGYQRLIDPDDDLGDLLHCIYREFSETKQLLICKLIKWLRKLSSRSI